MIVSSVGARVVFAITALTKLYIDYGFATGLT